MNRQMNMQLRQENQELRAENVVLKQAMAYPTCICCNQPVFRPELIQKEDDELRYENARLRADLERLRCLTKTYVLWSNRVWTNNIIPSIGSTSSRPTIEPNRNQNSSWLSFEAGMMKSANEVAQLAYIGEPVWTKTGNGDNEKLNVDEYYKRFFSCGTRKTPEIVHEASRATGLVSVDASFLAAMLMYMERWMGIFPSIVAALSAESVTSNNVQGARNQMVIPMLKAEFFQIMSPLASTRPVKFFRYCKQQDNNTWIVTDVSPDLRSNHPNLQSGFTRFPSGFVIQSMNNHCSKVTIVEQWEYDKHIIPHRLRTYLSSGLGFGAQRWLTALQRHWFISSIPLLPPHKSVHREVSPNGKVSLLSLSGRMVNAFCTSFFGLTNQGWEKFPVGATSDNVRIFTRKNQFRGSSCILISAVDSVWMPAGPAVVFNLLCEERKLDIWEHLRCGSEMHELVRIARGTEPGNHVSVFAQGQGTSHDETSKMFMLQEIYNYDWGSLIVHAPVDSSRAIVVMNGGDSSGIELLPSGFTILPGCFAEATAGSPQKPREEGCLLTVGFQIIADGAFSENLKEEKVKAIKQMVFETIQKVENALPVNLGLH